MVHISSTLKIQQKVPVYRWNFHANILFLSLLTTDGLIKLSGFRYNTMGSREALNVKMYVPFLYVYGNSNPRWQSKFSTLKSFYEHYGICVWNPKKHLTRWYYDHFKYIGNNTNIHVFPYSILYKVLQIVLVTIGKPTRNWIIN